MRFIKAAISCQLNLLELSKSTCYSLRAALEVALDGSILNPALGADFQELIGPRRSGR